MVAAVVSRLHSVRIRWVLDRFVEVDDTVKGATRANPFIDRFAFLLLFRSEVAGNGCAGEWCQCRAENLQPPFVSALNHLVESCNNVLGNVANVRWKARRVILSVY
jgi:hypothetical protein